MNTFLNKWYKNHALVYKILLFVVTTLFIVYLFPKTGKFRYSFENGKPWQSENLYAPFNFAIKKSQDEIDKERRAIEENSPVYFEVDKEVESKVLSDYIAQFNETFKDSGDLKIQNSNLFKNGKSFVDNLYDKGVLDQDYPYDDDRAVVLTSANTFQEELQYGDLNKLSNLRQLVEQHLGIDMSAQNKNNMISVFFDVIKPNTVLNENLTNKALAEELAKISSTRGSIEQDQLIISKGQVVEEEQYAILNSLKSEYESQVWNTANYNWVLVAYTLLVALALLMLLLFLRKYRMEVFLNNTKVTFIFFNIALMTLLTTLIINYNSQYIYVVPLCILPLVLKAFFDARLGLFTHVLTVLLLGFIVPNSYEYMFLQIIAGIVTILTVSELYKRANLFISVGQITFIYIIAYFAFFVIHEGQLTLSLIHI